MFLPSKYVIRQYIIVLSANLSCLGLGLSIAWSSPMLVKLMKEDTELKHRISEDDATWLVSCGFLLPIFSCHAIPWIANKLGRKKTLLLCGVLRAGINMLQIFASDLWMLYVLRGVTGIVDFGVVNTLPAYSAEIASKEIRGALGTIGQMSIAVGMLIMLSVGPYVSYLTVNIVTEVISILIMVPLFFIPESPCSLLRKGQTDEALKTLTYLRGSETKANEEIKEFSASSQSGFKTIDLFRDRIFLKALGLAVVLSIGMQSVGYITIATYLQTILDTTGSSVSSEVMSVVFGVMQLVAGLCTMVLSDKAGRKIILSITFVGIAIGMTGLGFFFYMKDSGSEITGIMNYVPIISLVIIVLCYNAGPGSLTIVVSAELFDNLARSFGISISVTSGLVFAFFNLKYFVSISRVLGTATVFWLFAGLSFLFMVFVLICIPETKQRSFLEIQKALGRKEVNDKDCKDRTNE